MSKIINILDVIKEYLRERLDSNEYYLEGAALFVIANAIGRISAIKYRHMEMPINLFSLFVGPTYISRKSSLLRLVRELCIYPNIPGDITQQALIHTLEDNEGFGWQYIDEIGDVFEELKTGKSYSKKIYRTYLILFTGLPYEKETRGSGAMKVENPCFSILGATTPSKVLSTLSETDIDGGFFPRFLTVWLDTEDINPDISTDIKYKIDKNVIYKELQKIKVADDKNFEEYDDMVLGGKRLIDAAKKAGESEDYIGKLEKTLASGLRNVKHRYTKRKKKFIVGITGIKIIKNFRQEIIKRYLDSPMMAFASNYENYLIKVAAIYSAGENFDYFIKNNQILILDEHFEKARDLIIECLRKIEKYYIEAITHSKDFVGAYRRAKTALLNNKLTIQEFHQATNTDKYTSDLVFDTISSQGLMKYVEVSSVEYYFIENKKNTAKNVREKVIDAISKDKRRVTEIYQMKGLKRREVELAIKELIHEGKIIQYDETDRGVEIYKLPYEKLIPYYRNKREEKEQEDAELTIEQHEKTRLIEPEEAQKLYEDEMEQIAWEHEQKKLKEEKEHQEFLEREEKIKNFTGKN